MWGSLWFWRVECQHCWAVLPLVPDVSLPRLYYAASVVLAVVVGRLGGESSKSFVPSRATQDRWIARFRFWWAMALAADAVDEPLESASQSGESLRNALWRCAGAGIRLVAPSHAPLLSDTVLEGRKRPTIRAHQT